MSASYRGNAFRHAQGFRTNYSTRTPEQQAAFDAAQEARRLKFIATCQNRLDAGEARRQALTGK